MIGFGLAYLQADKEYETTIEMKSSQTKDYVETVRFTTFPNVKIKYNQNLTGQGKVIFESELYTPIFVKIEASGYKTKRGFYLWKATDENVVLLEPIKESEKEKVPNKEKKENTTTEPTKVDMLPTFKSSPTDR